MNIVSIITIIFLLVSIVTGCKKNDMSIYNNQINSTSGSNPISQYNINIDRTLIENNISKSSNDDGGISIPSQALEVNSDAYTTYYILQSKKLAGINIDEQTKRCAKKYINDIKNENFDLLKLYYTILLCDKEDIKLIDIDTKDKIENFLDNLLNEGGYYSVSSGFDLKRSVDALLPTYMSVYILKRLDLPVKVSLSWINKASQELKSNLDSNNDYISDFTKYYDLRHLLDLGDDKDLPPEISYNYYKQYIKTNKIEQIKDMVLPVFINEFQKLSDLCHKSYTEYNDIMVNSLISDINSTNDYINDYDVYVLYTKVCSLSNLGYKNDLLLKSINKYEKFSLSDGTYILPGEIKSDIVNTYYAVRISNVLNLSINNDINIYIKNMSNTNVFDNGTGIYNYLRLLEEQDCMSYINDIKTDLVTVINDNLIKYVNDKSILGINNSLKSLQMLGYKPDKKIKDKIGDEIETFKESNEILQNAYMYANILEMISLLDTKLEIKKVAVQYLNDHMEEILKLNFTGKLNLTYLMIKSLNDSDCNCIELYREDVLEMINLSQHDSGLMKCGDNKDDTVSYESTSNAISLLEMLHYPIENKN